MLKRFDAHMLCLLFLLNMLLFFNFLFTADHVTYAMYLCLLLYIDPPVRRHTFKCCIFCPWLCYVKKWEKNITRIKS